VSLVASTGPSRGRSQRSLLVSVGTTFRTNKLKPSMQTVVDILEGRSVVVGLPLES
jgi:hypothetical protein